jgi:putative spermidine/putrescine transport system permease protein
MLDARTQHARWLLILPAGFLFLSFGVALAVFVLNSLLTNGGMGIVIHQLTLRNIQRLADGYYAAVLLHTAALSLLVVIFTTLLGFPFSLYLVKARSRVAGLCFILVLASSAMSLVVRALGWIGILTDNGVVNAFLSAIGAIDRPIQFLGSDFAIVVGLVHGSVPLYVLTLMPVLRSIDRNLELAAAGLGAGSWSTLFKITVPLSAPGLVGAGLLVFAMAMGAFTTPALLAGGRATVFAILIQQQVMTLLNYPMAAALSLALLLFVLVTVMAVTAAAGKALYGMQSR